MFINYKVVSLLGGTVSKLDTEQVEEGGIAERGRAAVPGEPLYTLKHTLNIDKKTGEKILTEFSIYQSLKGPSFEISAEPLVKSEVSKKAAKQIIGMYALPYSILATSAMKEGKVPKLQIITPDKQLQKWFAEELKSSANKGKKKLNKGVNKQGSRSAFIDYELHKQSNAWKKGVAYAFVGLGIGGALNVAANIASPIIEAAYMPLSDAIDGISVAVGPYAAAMNDNLQNMGVSIDAIKEAVYDFTDINAYVSSISSTVSGVVDSIPALKATAEGIGTLASDIATGVGSIEGYLTDMGVPIDSAKDAVADIQTEITNLTDYVGQLRDEATELINEGNAEITEASTPRTVDYSGDITIDADANDNLIPDLDEAGTQSGGEAIYNIVEGSPGTATDYEIMIHDDMQHRTSLMKSGLSKLDHAQDIGDICDDIDTSITTVQASSLAIYNSGSSSGYLVDLEGKMSDISTASAGISASATDIGTDAASISTQADSIESGLSGVQEDAAYVSTELGKIEAAQAAINTEVAKIENYQTNVETQVMDLGEASLLTGYTQAKNVVKGFTKTAGQITAYSLIAINGGVVAIPLLFGLKGYRTTKRANKALKTRGAPVALKPEIAFGGSEISVAGKNVYAAY